MVKVGNGGRVVASVLVGALCALSIAPSSPVAASPVPTAQIDTPADEARLLKAVEESLGRKRSLDAKVAELDGRLRETQTELRAAQTRLTALVARARTTEVKLNEVRQDMADAENALREQAIAVYTGRSHAGRLTDLLVHAANIGEIANRQSYIKAVSATQADLVLVKERLRDRTNDLLQALTAERGGAEAERNIIATRTAKVQADRDAQAAVRYQVNVEIANYDVLLKEIIGRQDEFEAQARELEAQSAAVAESLGRRTSSSSSSSASPSASSSSSSGGRLGAPLSSIRISSSFGWRIHPVFGSRRLHTGADLSATSGTPIRSAGDGVVVSGGWLGGYGNATVIDHGGGLATLYGHQSALLVRAGQEVERGQTIGRVGCTGTCTGPHLHYEVRINGNPVDPSPYL
ncbi:MAG: murein hydrolase activator EnvC family protein [Acidimicrobiales bacterium]